MVFDQKGLPFFSIIILLSTIVGYTKIHRNFIDTFFPYQILRLKEMTSERVNVSKGRKAEVILAQNYHSVSVI